MLTNLRKLLPHTTPVRRRFKPSIESLEDRSVPATFTVTTFADVVNPADDATAVSLREAISKANALPGADTIRLPAGTYKIGLVGSDNTNARGDFDVTDSLTLLGSNQATTFLEANTPLPGILRDRLFDVLGNVNMSFVNLTMRNTGNDQSHGGAVQALTANVTLNSVTVSNTRALKGGAVNAEAGTVSVLRSTLRDNVSLGNGGAINAGTGAVTVTLSTVTNNSAQGRGGGVFADTGNVRLSQSTLTRGQAAKGGGIATNSGAVTLVLSTVSNNRGFDDLGGGIFTTTGNVAVDRSSMANNTSGFGGAIFAQKGNVSLSRSTLSRNVAFEQGGGIHAANGTVTLANNSAVKLNAAGQSFDGGSTGVGGGVFAKTVVVTASTVTGNFTLADDDSANQGSGGGIHATDSVTVTSSTISGNRTPGAGGGIHAGNAVTMTNSTVSNNRAGQFGGGIDMATATITNSTISGNVAAGFGGGGLGGANATLTNTTVRDNSTTGRGGGLAVGTTTIVRSTISGNRAGTDGGGIHTFRLTMTNGTVSGNQADGSGGGISTLGGSIASSTIVENFAAGDGGGVRYTLFGSIPPLRFKNTIVADNFSFGVGQDVRGDMVSDGNNLIGIVEGSTGFGAAGDQLGTLDSPLDPLLGALANNGGPTMTHALLAGSTAIDRGNNAGAPATDQRGLARVKDGDANGIFVLDVGAFEF